MGLPAVFPTALWGQKAALARGSFSLGKIPWRYKASQRCLALGWGTAAQSGGAGGCTHGEGGHCGRCPGQEAALQHHGRRALTGT